MSRILITGANGNVGKVLVERLVEQGYDVRCLIKGVSGDLMNYESLLKVCEDVDIVVHLAGLIEGSKKNLMNVNVEGTRNLVRACEEKGVKKIIFISSLDVKFKSNYGVSKLMAEGVVRDSEMEYIVLRPSVIYGRDFKKGVGSLLRILKKSFFIPIIGSGENLYQPIYVGDLVFLIEKIISESLFENKIYFVGGGSEISLLGLIDLICLKIGKKVVKFKVPFSRFLKRFKISAFESFFIDKICDNGEIHNDFGFYPLSVEEGIEKII